MRCSSPPLPLWNLITFASSEVVARRLPSFAPSPSPAAAPRRHPPPGTRRAAYRSTLLPSFLLPSTPPPSFFIFNLFFFFLPPEAAASHAREQDSMPLGTSTKPGSFPAHMFGAPRESLMQGSPRFSPRENRAEFPQRPSQAELVRINKDLTFSHPPAPLRAISAFVSRWVTG